MSISRRLFAVVLTAAMISISTSQIPPCASKLGGCFNYLNATTTPPATCCDPLKAAITNERPCLCNLYNNPQILKGLQINVTQVMALPALCDIDVGKDPTDLCKGVAQPPSSAGSVPATPTTPGAGSGSGGSNGAATMDKITGTGLLAILLVLSAYVVYY